MELRMDEPKDKLWEEELRFKEIETDFGRTECDMLVGNPGGYVFKIGV